MTDKERIEVYVKELPNNCAECEHCTKAHEGKFGIPFCNVARMPIYNGQDIKGRGHHTDSFNDFDCPLKTIQSVQNQNVVEALEKVKQFFDDKLYEAFGDYACDNDYLTLNIWDIDEFINKLIKEYGDNNASTD